MTDQKNPSHSVPRIESIRIKNYRALRDLERKPLSALLGASGSVKPLAPLSASLGASGSVKPLALRRRPSPSLTPSSASGRRRI